MIELSRDEARRFLLAVLENRREDAFAIVRSARLAGASVDDVQDHLLATVQREVGRMWLMADYLTEVRDLDHQIFPPMGALLSWLDRPATVEVFPIPRDTPDHSLLSFWAHPERVLDEAAREATSGFARQPREGVERVVGAVEADLRSGRWDERYGHLRGLEAFDAGLRIVTARLTRR